MRAASNRRPGGGLGRKAYISISNSERPTSDRMMVIMMKKAAFNLSTLVYYLSLAILQGPPFHLVFDHSSRQISSGKNIAIF